MGTSDYSDKVGSRWCVKGSTFPITNDSSPICGLPPSSYDDFKTSPHLFAPKSPIKPQLFTCPPEQTNSPLLPQHTNKHLLRCTFSKSLKHNKANLKDPIIKASKYRAPLKTLKKKEGFT